MSVVGAYLELKDKFRGTLVGAAVGDALGAPFEGAISVDPKEVQGVAENAGVLRYTHDTHMTLGMAQSLMVKGRFDGADMASIFVDNFTREPWRGYGPGTFEVLSLIARGARWDEAAQTLFEGSGSFGNGAAMWVAPTALLGFNDMGRIAGLARRTAAITHTHELGIEGAVLQACAVAQALHFSAGDDIDSGTFLEGLDAQVRTDVFRQKLGHVRSILAHTDLGIRDEVVGRLGNGVASYESVPTAIYSFLRHHQSFEDVVIYAVSLGGDTDTIASMAGALAGAYLGLERIPSAWRDGVEGGAGLQELADGLLSLALGTAS